MPLSSAGLPAGYAELLEDLKSRVRTAQLKAALSVNREMIPLYWDIGRLIVERQQREGWGKGIVDRLAKDVQKAFPGLKGFSPSNVWLRAAEADSHREGLQLPSATGLSWALVDGGAAGAAGHGAG